MKSVLRGIFEIGTEVTAGLLPLMFGIFVSLIVVAVSWPDTYTFSQSILDWINTIGRYSDIESILIPLSFLYIANAVLTHSRLSKAGDPASDPFVRWFLDFPAICLLGSTIGETVLYVSRKEQALHALYLLLSQTSILLSFTCIVIMELYMSGQRYIDRRGLAELGRLNKLVAALTSGQAHPTQ